MARGDEALGLRDGTSIGAVPTLPEVAYLRLREAILSGAFEAGEPLRQEEIAQRIGASRVPVREALKQLEVEGLVVLRPRRGFIVASLDPEEIEDIFDIRAMLEERAGYVATLKRTDEDVAAVESLARAMDGMTVVTTVDVALFAERNRAFHTRLFETSGRTHLCRMMMVLRNSVERYIRLGAWIAGNLDAVHRDHRHMVEAFRRGDAEEVGRLCRQHCEATCARLTARLRRQREKQGS